MRERDFDDADDKESGSDEHFDQKQMRKMQKERDRKLKKKKKGTVFEDGFDTHKKNPYKRERFDSRSFLR